MIRIPSLNALGVAASLLLAAPAWSQAPLPAPNGWVAQDKANGAQAFSPPDLQPGEAYSVTAYASAPKKGTLEEHLRAFAGPVGDKPGQLAAALKIQVREGSIVSGTGAYVGPNGAALGVLFLGVTLDGGDNIHIARTLFSLRPEELLNRYADANSAIVAAMMARARREAGRNLITTPGAVKEKMKPGGAIKPGIYEGSQYNRGELKLRLRLHIYPNGEYRATGEDGAALVDRWGDVAGVGRYGFNRDSGMMTFDDDKLHLITTPDSGGDFCYFGHDAAGKPVIYSERNDTFRNIVTSLAWVAPLSKRDSPRVEAEKKRAAEIEAARFKWAVAPGKGVPMAKIEGVWFHQMQIGSITNTEVSLLLKDGTAYNRLPVPPDELDVAASRRNEPKEWGRWRVRAGKHEVSWASGPWDDLPGFRVTPGAPKTRLSGQYSRGTSMSMGSMSSYSLFNVFFDESGRFAVGSRSGTAVQGAIGDPNSVSTYTSSDQDGTSTSVLGQNVTVAANTKSKNPRASSEGTYEINGYTITLRYDDGDVVRRPFFFGSSDRRGLWFGGGYVARMDK